MSPKVTAEFRALPLSDHSKKYLTDVTAQQCSTSEIYWKKKCDLKTKKPKK